MPDAPIVIPAKVEEAIAQTLEQQAAADKVGLDAAGAALPGPLRDVFSPAPDIKVGKWNVRRFVDRDFVFLSQIGHPLKRFTAMADGSYDFEPSGELAWHLCYICTHSIADIKALFKSGGPDAVKEAAADMFGEQPLFAIGKVMEAIAKQMTLYASAHQEVVAKKAEGENGGDVPPSS